MVVRMIALVSSVVLSTVAKPCTLKTHASSADAAYNIMALCLCFCLGWKLSIAIAVTFPLVFNHSQHISHLDLYECAQGFFTAQKPLALESTSIFPSTIEGCRSWQGRFRCLSFGAGAWSPVRRLSLITALAVAHGSAFMLILGLQAFMTKFTSCSADAGCSLVAQHDCLFLEFVTRKNVHVTYYPSSWWIEFILDAQAYKDPRKDIQFWVFKVMMPA